jgi:antitoxin component of RelBE/YafQ-DinJ toxin-antitoxin module
MTRTNYGSGPTPHRNFRVEDEVWEQAEARARESGLSVSQLLRGWLADYAEGRMPSVPVDPWLAEVAAVVERRSAAS